MSRPREKKAEGGRGSPRNRSPARGSEAAERSGLAPGRGPFRFGPANYAAFALGIGAIVLGYVQLDQGSVTAAPILLILGYAVLLPLGLILGWRGLD